MFREEDDRSVVMEGMPMFLLSKSWYDNWREYTADKGEGGALKQERQHPGPITQFDLIDQIYNIYFDSKSNKDYTNRYYFSTIDYFMVPKRCWLYFKEKYGGIEAKRFNISYIDKPHEIFTEVHLKRILIARYDTNKTI